MGYYIEVPRHKEKAQQIVELYGGQIVNKPAKFSDIPEDKALVVVVDNGMFEAAAVAYNEREFIAFHQPWESRHRDYVLLDKAKAFTLVRLPQILVDKV